MGCHSYHTSYPDTCLSNSQTQTFMHDYTRQILEWLNNEGRWVDRYAWYIDWGSKDPYYTQLYHFTPTPALIDVERSGIATPTPTPTLRWNPSTLGRYSGRITPAAPLEFNSLIYLPIIRR
jgi:hypothetical protein